MKLVLLLALLTVGECGSSSVVGQTGNDVTLPCKYDIGYYKALSVCWGRGTIPGSGCNDLLISTDGHKVTEGSRASSRYQLLGRLDEGDVSLTIQNVTASDSGRYGCRVEIPGWFNDDKHHFDLTVETAAQTTTSTTSTRQTPTEQTAGSDTAGQATSTETRLTSSSSSTKAEESRSLTVVLLWVLFGSLALLSAGGLVVFVRRWKNFNKVRQQQVHSLVQFTWSSSTLPIHSRGSAVENIYQIDADDDGGEYDYCP